MKSKFYAASALALAVSLSAAAPKAEAKVGTTTITGRRTDWPRTQLVEAFAGGLWTIEKGTLTRTDLNGTVSQFGTPGEYTNPVDMAVVDDTLFVLDGTVLYRVSDDGTRTRVGTEETLVPVMRFLTNYDDELWGIETDGTLHRLNQDGTWTTVGETGGLWVSVSQFFSYKGQLYTVALGTLYRCDREAKWQHIGPVGDWKVINFMVPTRNRIWMVGNTNMISVNTSGRKTLIGKGRWPRLDALTALNGDLVGIRSDGTIILTSTK
ncbi:MAG TPA: hypothetical protein VF681_05875 [Abditibacteriaceae bacterium]|jgi:hypothetical protein